MDDIQLPWIISLKNNAEDISRIVLLSLVHTFAQLGILMFSNRKNENIVIYFIKLRF